MRLGKNFGFWVRIAMAILKAILPFLAITKDLREDAGERLVRNILDVVILYNKDDALMDVDDAEKSTETS